MFLMEQIEIQVIRKADILLDFESESGFEETELISGSLEETEYEPYMDELEDFDEDDIDVEIEVGGETFIINKKKDAYTTCSICGKPLSMLNDSGGICYECYCKYDV